MCVGIDPAGKQQQPRRVDDLLVLAGEDLRGLELPHGAAVPVDLRVETDQPVDDLGCELRGGGHAYLQVKRSLPVSERAAE